MNAPLNEEYFWDSLRDQDAIDNTAGVPPYDLKYVADRICRGTEMIHQRVLDLGCGMGRLTNYLAEWFPHSTFHGVDISGRMLGIAAMDSRHLENTFYWHGNGRELPPGIGARFFDLAYSITMLQHIPDDAKWGYIREVYKWLRPGGVFVFTVATGEISEFLNYQIDDLAGFANEVGELYGSVEIFNDGWTWLTARKALNATPQ